MYLPDHFALTDPAALYAIIGDHPFATLVTQGTSGLIADHLPLLLSHSAEDPGLLFGHIARANPLWQDGECDALAIFHGPQAYITPSWYPAKREHGRVVPTWNYQVVHAHGRLRFIDDADWLQATVGALTERFEQQRKAPWRLDDAPAAYLGKMLSAIVGVEITLTRLEGKHKASQHRPNEERAAIRTGLQTDDGMDTCSAGCLSGDEQR